MTAKHRCIISYLKENRLETATQIVNVVSAKMKCSKSSVWDSFNDLKNYGIISHNNNIAELSDIGKSVKIGGNNE